MLTCLVFVGKLAPSVTDIQLQAFAAAARIRHRRQDVTGMLVRGTTHVAHVLEGRAQALSSVMAWAGSEPTLQELRIVVCEPVERRRFDDWCVAAARNEEVAAEIAELHRGGLVGQPGLTHVLDRLTLAGVDEPLVRLLVEGPRLIAVRPGPEPVFTRRRTGEW